MIKFSKEEINTLLEGAEIFRESSDSENGETYCYDVICDILNNKISYHDLSIQTIEGSIEQMKYMQDFSYSIGFKNLELFQKSILYLEEILKLKKLRD